MKTKNITLTDIKREWHLVNVDGEILGRVASKIAEKLIGKDKTYYVSHLDCGDYVVVINASKVHVTGRKEKQKMYYRHSGFPGGFKQNTFEQEMAKDPRNIIVHAVKGMLPQNKLLDKRLKRLKVFVDEKHIYEDKFKQK